MKIGDITNYPLPIVTDIAKIQPGQAIACEYTATSGAFGAFANLGNTTKDLIDLPSAASDIDGAFLFICVGYTPDGNLKLIADRNIQNFISWETLNTASLCNASGLDFTVDDFSPHQSYRLLSSVEWDEVLVNHNLGGLITDAATFYHTDSPSWMIDASSTPANRIIRGGVLINDASELVSTGSSGFRLVLIYDPVPKILHRPDNETTCPLPLVSDIKKIEPGQAISCEYTAVSSKFGQFANLGKAIKSHISDLAPESPDGTFYFICVGYTPNGSLKLIADRNIQGKISWETLNSSGVCTTYGASINIDNIDGLKIRLPETISDRHVDDKNYGEWDAIISFYDLDEVIEPSDNTVWNCLSIKSWTLATLSVADDAGTVASQTLRIARGGQDSGYVALRQSKYDSGSIDENVGFRPVLVVKRESRFLYLKEDGSCYTVDTQNVLEKIAENWTALTDTEKNTLLRTKGNEIIAKAKVLQELKKFKIIAFAVGKEDKATIMLSAIPHKKIVFPSGLINIENFEGIDQVALNGTFTGAGKCIILVTVNLTDYKTYKNGTWQDIDITDLAAVVADGMDNQTIGNIPRAGWDTITIGESGIGFAYLPIVEKVSDKAEIDELVLHVDMKGNWEMALPGVDYNYCYPRNDRLKVTILMNGDYKINYSEG